MVNLKDVPPEQFIQKLKEELKKFNEISPPQWTRFVKSGPHRERPPEQSDFWFIRAASILRRVYIDGGVGVGRMRTHYGGRKRRGYKPAHFRKSSGNVIRKIVQQLEHAGLVEKGEKKVGRRLTSKGRKFLDKVAKEAESK